MNNCVYREGDDPQWSRADYDDSTWSKAAPDFINELPLSRFVWQRCGFNTRALPADSPLSVQLNTPFSLRLYLDGRFVGAIGNPETGETSIGAIARLTIPGGLSDRLSARPAPHRIAVRYTRTVTTLVALPFPAIGPSQALELRRFQIIRDNLKTFWLSLATAPFILAASLVLLILSGADPSRRAAFWFGVVAGSEVLLTDYLDSWLQELYERRLLGFQTAQLAQGIYPMTAEAERSFSAGEVSIDGREIEHVRIEVEFGVQIIRPAVISDYEVSTRGRVIRLARATVRDLAIDTTFVTALRD